MEQAKKLIPELHIPNQDKMYKCDVCKDVGRVSCDKEEADISYPDTVVDNQGNFVNVIVYQKKCQCRIDNEFKYHMQMSGIGNVEGLSFKNYITKYQWQKHYLKLAKEFKEEKRQLFFISGPSGSGKTRLCSTLFKHMVYDGKEGYYMAWEKEIIKAKNNYSKISIDDFNHYVRIPILYIDDFLKSPGNDISKVSDVELSIARSLINARYAAKNKITIISTELTDKQLRILDHSMFGRLQEMATQRYLIVMNPKEDRDIRNEIYKGEWNND